MSGNNIIRLVPSPGNPHLSGGGNGPDDPGMEARLSRLEADFQAMRADLSAIRADTAYTKGRVEGLPSTWQMIWAILGCNIALAGVIFAAAKLLAH